MIIMELQTHKVLLALCLDRSGSMAEVKSAVISATNEFIDSQDPQKNSTIENVPTDLGIVVFNDYQFWIGSNDLLTPVFCPVSEFTAFTAENYRCSGCTALYDAIERTIHGCQAHCESQPNTIWTVIVVIQTDGVENASLISTAENVRELISTKQRNGWQFTFLGANQDACLTAQHIGINANSALSYKATPEGTIESIKSLTCAVTRFRSRNNAERINSVLYN